MRPRRCKAARPSSTPPATTSCSPGCRPTSTSASWCGRGRSARAGGVTGLLHQDGIFDDPKGGALREAVYGRLRWVFRFKNELQLFPDVGHVRPFALTISGATAPADFATLCNLFHPSTVEACLEHDGAGAVPGIKTDDGEFETRGHARRVVRVTEAELALFASLFDKPGTPASRARLPLVQSSEALEVLRKLARHPRRLGHLGDDVFGTEMWHETNAQKDGTIRRETRFAKSAREWILSGPHFYVGTPLYKTPREICDTKNAYDVLDLEALPDDYLPRTNYVPACDAKTYLERTPRFRGRPVTEMYRHVHRSMLAMTGERTVIPAVIVPTGPGHLLTRRISLSLPNLEALRPPALRGPPCRSTSWCDPKARVRILSGGWHAAVACPFRAPSSLVQAAPSPPARSASTASPPTTPISGTRSGPSPHPPAGASTTLASPPGRA